MEEELWEDPKEEEDRIVDDAEVRETAEEEAVDDEEEEMADDGVAYSLERSFRAYCWLSGRTSVNCGLFAFTANMNFCLPAAAAAAANSWFDVRIAAAEVALSPPFGPPGNDCCDCCRW